MRFGLYGTQGDILAGLDTFLKRPGRTTGTLKFPRAPPRAVRGVGLPMVVAAATLVSGCAGIEYDVAVEAHAERDGDRWLLVAQATNEGPEPITYRHGCQQAWTHTLSRQGEPVDMGTAPCHGFRPEELAPGATHTLEIAWDGTASGEEAPPAAYVWRVSFLDVDGQVVATDTAVINKGQGVNRAS